MGMADGEGGRRKRVDCGGWTLMGMGVECAIDRCLGTVFWDSNAKPEPTRFRASISDLRGGLTGLCIFWVCELTR